LTVPGRECTGACAEFQNEEGGKKRSAAIFAGASEDGRRVFFTTAQPMVNADGDTTADLYMAELDETSVTRLVFVSEGGVGNPTPGVGAQMVGVVRVSMDGSRVYFVAKGLLTTEPNANGEVATLGSNNLFVYEPALDRTAFVAKLVAGDSADWSAANFRTAQTSVADGRFLVFLSKAHLLGTGNTSGNGTNVAQLFRYDALSGAVVRASVGQRGDYLCPQTGIVEDGYNCNGNVQATAQAPVIPRQDVVSTSFASDLRAKVVVTSDGTVFFISKTALTPKAANGFPNFTPGFVNVYEYRDGNVFLISDGQEGIVATNAAGNPLNATLLFGTVADGEGVMFASPSALVPQDTDTQISIYSARVGGGFPAPPITDVCKGEECRGPLTTPGTSVAVPSALQRGKGNVQRNPRRTRRKCRPNKRGTSRARARTRGCRQAGKNRGGYRKLETRRNSGTTGGTGR
jgi:hypothetical protein